jgi:phage terminase large subunit
VTTAQLPDWAQCLFDEDLRYICLRGGRGSGKSRSVASALVIRGAAKQTRILCAREIQKSIRDSVKRLLDDEIERCGLGDFYTSTETEIRGKNGSLFLFAGLRTNIDSVKSMEGIDICWVEEAQTVSQGSLDVLVPTIRKPGSQILFTWNPRLETDPVDAMFCGDSQPPKTHLARVNWDQNPWFPDVLRAEMEYDKRRDPDKYAHVWMGQYQQSSEARVFRNWKVDEFDIDPNWTLRQGADWGYSVDPSVLVQCAIVGRTLYVAHEAYRVGCDIDFLPELFGQVPESERWPTIADSSRPETISYMQRHGYKKMLPAIKGARSVEEGIEFLRTFDIIVHPRCIHTIQELTAYSYEVDDMTGLVLPKLKDKDNHVIDSLRYACEGARRAAKTVAKLDFSKSEAQGMRA